MRAILEGKLYDTEISELIHQDEFYSEGEGMAVEGLYTQSLYRTPNGAFFYVNTFPHSKPAFYLIGGKLDIGRTIAHTQGRKWDEIDGAIDWLERHHGTEVILERWPERVWAG